MNKYSVLSQLKSAINNASYIVTDSNTNSQQLCKGEIITLTTTISSNVDYDNLTALVSIEQSMPQYMLYQKSAYEANTQCLTGYNTLSNNPGMASIPYTKEAYENLFKPGGILYPINLTDLVPASSCNCNGCENYYYPNMSSGCMMMDISNTLVICKRSENMFDATLTITGNDSGYNLQTITYVQIRCFENSKPSQCCKKC